MGSSQNNNNQSLGNYGIQNTSLTFYINPEENLITLRELSPLEFTILLFFLFIFIIYSLYNRTIATRLRI